jgi:hypothetical protein
MHDDKNDRDDNELYVFQDSQQQLDLQQQWWQQQQCAMMPTNTPTCLMQMTLTSSNLKWVPLVLLYDRQSKQWWRHKPSHLSAPAFISRICHPGFIPPN